MLWKTGLLVVVVMGVVQSAQAQSLLFRETGISGFYDYQTNYRTPQYLRMCRQSSIIHATMMVADDSLNPSASRRTAYAFSSDGGMTWTTFNQIRVPERRSGFPSLEIGQNSFSCVPIIANHGVIGGGVIQSTIFLDYPPGGGSFTEIFPPPFLGGDEPGFPETAGAADGSVIMLASRFAAGSLHWIRIPDFITWSQWGTFTLDFVSDGFVAEADTSGKVGVVINTPGGPLHWFESTNNGISWPITPSELLPDTFSVGGDRFVTQQGLDLVHLRGDTLVTFGVAKLVDEIATERNSGIGFWSARTGFVLAAPHTSIPGVADTLRKRQTNQHTVGYPAIGLSGSTIVIAFQAFMPETSAAGFNYSDIFFTFSTDHGSTWSSPSAITHTLSLDERYPSMSKWNPDGEANFIYQEDTEPGSGVFTDNAPLSRNRQKFCKVYNLPTGVNGAVATIPIESRLFQNYPNPFNPVTEILFTVSTPGFVTLKIHDVLGREVATLVDELKQPGTYTVQWNARNVATGVYYSQLTIGNLVETKKLVLLR